MNSTAVAPAKLQPNSRPENPLLLAGGYFSLAFAAFQLTGVFWPPKAIRHLGGPAQLSIARPVLYALLCVIVAAAAAVFGLYDLSGAGKIRRLPLLRTVVTLATLIYVLRGLVLFPQILIVINHPYLVRFAVFSLVSLVVGLVHLGGLVTLCSKFGRSREAPAG
jgi:hypothetical protein